MSSGMSEREIDDVLKSVRRLVAQEERRDSLPPLVLTPEMRVDAGPEAAGVPDPVDEPQASGEPEMDEVPADPDGSASPLASDDTAGLPARHAPPPPPALPDDAALQEMVAQIVRDELNGKLGEKITLAVRKLVRNEIARAMDEQRRK